jgi:signal transduction histidine kinase
MDVESSAPLRFPDVPKLELDDLIDQLVERAHGVKAAQGRLRALLRAIETVSQNLSIDVVLSSLVEAACELAGARYGALGVVGPQGGLEQFLHVGMDPELVERIGHLPAGKGLLGALITDPQPIRLPHMAQDDRSVGFPADHPPMDSFLGVPIRTQEEVFGNLYLADSIRGEFSAEDEELVVALAFAAGTAVSHARLYDESTRQQRWLRASAEISGQVLAAAGGDPLPIVARVARDVAEADLVTVALVTPDGRALAVHTAEGDGAERLFGQRVPLEETAAAAALELQAPQLLVDAMRSERTDRIRQAIDAGPTVIIPLTASGQVPGVLTLVRRRGRTRFSVSDLEMASGFANHASVAIELADSRAAEQKLVLLQDRDRIAQDLHDHVIQELFAVGLSLETVASTVADPDLGDRLRLRVDDLDRTIRRIRTSIFELRGPLDLRPDGLQENVVDVVSELTPVLGLEPAVSVTGATNAALSTDLVDDVLAVLREALTNVAKHARATAVGVDVALTPEQLTVTIADDGIGIGKPTRRSGTSNLESRAMKRGGTCTIEGGPTGGTTVVWSVPRS